jgi:TonB family protein
MLCRVVILVLVFGAAAHAQDRPNGAPAAGFTPAVPLVELLPQYPEAAERLGREGWVTLSFVVSETGRVIESMIEDSSGDVVFEDEALRTVGAWRYEPATLSGTPVEQAMTNVRLVFAMESGRGRVNQGFRGGRNEILDLIRTGRLDAAGERLARLRDAEKINLGEDASYWWIRVAYLEALSNSDPRELRASLQRALQFGTIHLEPDAIDLASERLYGLQVQDLDFGAARKTFERLRETPQARRSDAYAVAVGNMEAHYANLEALIDGSDPFSVSARIGERGYWVRELVRRSFSIVNVEGTLETIDIRCARGTRRYPWVSEDSTWNIPESWGDCGVYVKGAEGSTFGFYVYPPE